MSKDRKKLLHIHSSVNDKQPTPATLELGELGVNNAKGNAFISTKNSDGEVVRFSEDETIIGWMEQKEVFPYEGYMRGADNSQVDGVTEQDLLDNKSNLIIKLNQVVPENTDYSPYDEKVNGAKDIYGNLINPISSGGYKDGAGLAIDMSKYAMIGANPSFSSITTTCHATLNGTTEIKGKGDGCGSKFTVEVANACIDASDTLNEYGVNHSNFGTSCDGTKISNDTTLKGKKVFIDSPSGNLTVDIQACNHISGRTNDFVIRECQDNGGKVEIDTTDIDVSASTTDIKSCDRISAVTDNFIIEQCSSGKTHIHSCAGITLESKNITLTDGNCGSGQTTIEVNDLCLVGERKINIYGDETNVGIDCDDNTIATNTRVFGKGTLITTKSTPSAYSVENNVEIVAAQDIKENADRDISESTTNGNINESAKNINNTASNDICDTAANNATFYGSIKTNVGINCDDTVTAATTTVKGGKVIVDASTTDLGLTAKQNIVESAEGDIIISANDNICVQSGDEIHLFGFNKTYIGRSCDGSKSEEIVYERIPKTDACAIKSNTIDDALEEVMARDRVFHTEQTASDGTKIHTVWQDSGDCENSFTFEIRNTKVKMSAETYPASSEYLKKYVLWQEVGTTREDIGEIDIPKDHVLKDAKIVNGKVNGDTFTPCNGDADCQWYIELTWNVFDPTSGHTSDKTIYVPANSLVQDNSYDNTSAIKFETFYDGEKTHVSADTTVKVHTSNNVEQSATKSNGEHTLSSYTLTIHQGGDTNVFDPFASDAEITMNHSALTINYGREGDVERTVTYDTAEAATVYIPTEVSDLGRGNLTIQHNNGSGETYDPGSDSTILLNHSALTINYGVNVSGRTSSTTYDTSASSVIDVPTHISDMGRGTLKWQYGANVCDLDTETLGEYDPGDSGATINIPSSIENITNNIMSLNGNICESASCLTIDTDICVTDGHTVKADGFYATSDERMKENIESINATDYEKAGLIDLKSFNFKNDETKTKTYGVIAQALKGVGLDNIVHNDDEGNLSVDYISFLILRIAKLESELKTMEGKLNELLNNEK